MAIVFEHGIDLPQAPHQVFGLLDDFSRVPQWLKRCEGLAKQGQGPNAEGDKLRYAYCEGGRHGVMDGVIVTREDGRRLTCRYYDRMFQVVVDFMVSRNDDGTTHLVHHIEITPNSFMAKLMAPMIRGKLPQQTISSMENLRLLLAAETV